MRPTVTRMTLTRRVHTSPTNLSPCIITSVVYGRLWAHGVEHSMQCRLVLCSILLQQIFPLCKWICPAIDNICNISTAVHTQQEDGCFCNPHSWSFCIGYMFVTIVLKLWVYAPLTLHIAIGLRYTFCWLWTRTTQLLICQCAVWDRRIKCKSNTCGVWCRWCDQQCALSEGTKLRPKKLNLQGLTDSDGHCIAVRKQ